MNFDHDTTDTLRQADKQTLHATLFHSCVALLALYALCLIAFAATDGHHDAASAVLGVAALSACIGVEMRQ